MGTTEEAGAVERRWQRPVFMLRDFAGEDQDAEVMALGREFLEVRDACVALNPEAGTGSSGCSEACSEQYQALNLKRTALLQRLMESTALGVDGLNAKSEVLSAMVDWLDFGDSRLARFAVQLAGEYRQFVNNQVSATSRPSSGLSLPSLRSLVRVAGAVGHFRFFL